MTNDTPPQIFLSYAWANAAIADEIDNDFKAIGITFLRDVRDVQYASSIKKFMHRIGKSDFVVMLISDEYIKSENCMYEVTELLGAHEFEKRILPVIVNNAPVFNRDNHRIYYQHWQFKLKEANIDHGEFGNEHTLDGKRKIQSINDYLGVFFQKITDLKSEEFERLKRLNYKPILEKIGFQQGEIAEQILVIDKIEDQEDQELALENIVLKYLANPVVLSYRAHSAFKNKQYKKAKKYYEELLQLFPENVVAHNNFALLLQEHFAQYDAAREHYEKAIVINPEYANAHYNFAILLTKYFALHFEAKQHYEQAILINPKFKNADNDVSHVTFLLYEEAKKRFNAALVINSQPANIHYNFAKLLNDYFSNYEEAKYHYEQALNIDPLHIDAHNSYAFLLEYRFTNFLKAKNHYEIALQIKPDFIKAKNNLDRLITNHFS